MATLAGSRVVPENDDPTIPRTSVSRSAHDEADLIEATRNGSSDAFGTLYAHHVDDVSRLARRLCRDRYEADDVVSDVFCNTLRALRRGAGPSDALLPYLLRSVRNTVIKSRTRADSGRSDPAAPDTLDRPDDHDPYRAPGAEVVAFEAVSERHRRVLWSVEIEGVPTASIAELEDVAVPAAASLAYRARCALRRAYIGASMSRPAAATCTPIRTLMPSFVDGGLGATKTEAVRDHSARCDDCATALARAQTLKSRLADKAPFAALFLGLRAVVALTVRSVGGVLAAAPVTAVIGTAAVTIALGVVVEAEPAPDQGAVTGDDPLADERTDTTTSGTASVIIPARTANDVGTSSRIESVDSDRAPTERLATLDPDRQDTAEQAPGDVDQPTDESEGDGPSVLGPSEADPVQPTLPINDLTDSVDDLLDTTTNNVVGATTGVVNDAVVVVDTTTDVVDDIIDVVDRTVTTVADLQVVHDVADVVVEQPVTDIVDAAAADAARTLNTTVGNIADVVTGNEEAASGGLLGGLGN